MAYAPSSRQSTQGRNPTVDCNANLTFTWTVEWFKIWKEEIVLSPLFSGHSPYGFSKWRLLLYPNGDATDSLGYLSLYLQLIEPTGVSVTAEYRASLINKKGLSVASTVSSAASYPYNASDIASDGVIGFSKFVKRGTVCVERAGFLINRDLVIKCEITFSGFNEARNEEEEAEEGAHEVVRDLEQMLEDETLSDLILEVEDKKIHAHKNILASRSPVFKAMFEPHTEESADGVVVISDMGYEEVSRMVRFIYTGKVEAKFCTLSLLSAADRYHIKRLMTICEKQLGLQLNADNAVQVLIEAEKYPAINLYETALGFIVRNGKKVKQTEDWKYLETHPKIMLQIIDRMSDLS